MKNISKTFFTGMATVLPIAITLYLLYWFATSAEALLGGALRRMLPEGLYWPGLGLILSLALILLVGALMHAWVVRRLVETAEALLYRVPLVKSVYGAIRDFFTLFSGADSSAARQPVMVRLAGIDAELLGFVMREDFHGMPAGIAVEGRVAVYLPLSYQIGGYMVLLPRAALRPLDMSVEEAMRFALTAGLTTHGGPGEGHDEGGR